MSRRLSSARCQGKGHLLAELVAEGDRLVCYLPRLPVSRLKDGKGFVDHRTTAPERFDVTALDAAEVANATCGCKVDHPIDISALRERAVNGDTRPMIVPPLQR